jgi:zinc and cadmium transporter
VLWLWVTIAVVLDGAVALVGGLLPERWLVKHRPVMLGFAAGAVIAAALLDLVPDAYALLGAWIVPWVIGTMIALAIVEHLFAHHVGVAAPYALLGSDALHNFADGMAIAAAFVVSTRLGVVTSLAVIVHELPEEIALYTVLRAAGFGKTRALLALTAVQLTAGLGAAAALLGATIGNESGALLAIAAGTFLYVAFELLPLVVRSWRALIALAAGALVVAIAS